MSASYKYIADLVTEQQMRTNRFVNLSSDDIDDLLYMAAQYDMGEIEIIDTILTLGYA